MHLKKLVFLGSALVTLSIPMTAFAELYTYNFTNEDSSVKVTSGSKFPCSSDAGVYTPKKNPDGSPGQSTVKDGAITLLCLTSKNTCTANIYNSKNCTGDKVGEAALDLKTKRVTMAKSTNSRYRIDVEKNGTVLNLTYTS